MIQINGKNTADAKGLRLKDFLLRENYNLQWIAVECNGLIVPKQEYEKKIILDGDVYEIVNFVGGG